MTNADRKSVPREPAPDQPAAPSLEKWAATKEAWDACEAAPPADDLCARLRNTPNWLRQEFGPWKDATSHYDRAPFEAAARIEALTKERDTFYREYRMGVQDELTKAEARVAELEAALENMVNDPALVCSYVRLNAARAALARAAPTRGDEK